MKIKDKEQNLLLDQTLMERNQVVHLYLIAEGVVVMTGNRYEQTEQ